MIKIYCIEDINDLKYVGSTKQKLKVRMRQHRTQRDCSSDQLNLDYSMIYTLEECEEDLRKERERHWINTIDCVNVHKLNGEDLIKRAKRDKAKYDENREKKLKVSADYYKKNKEVLKAKRRERYRLAKDLDASA